MAEKLDRTWTEWLANCGTQSLYDPGTLRKFASLPWSPGEQDRRAAWEMFIELSSRIATQALPYRSGDERGALKSIYELFGIFRKSVNTNFGCLHFSTLALCVLNDHVRPFTAKWHRLSVDGRLDSADVRFEFRRDLIDLQPKLRALCKTLGNLIGNDAAMLADISSTEVSATIAWPAMWDPIPFGIDVATSDIAQAEVINSLEAKEVQSRRQSYQQSNAATMLDAVGISISGGGIRSATFALGVVQVLSKRGLLSQVDFLSTVSGGGYIGAFLSSFMNQLDSRVTLNPGSESYPFGADDNIELPPVRHLRNHSRYLSEGGLGTLLTVFWLAIYGIAMSFLLFVPAVLALVVFLATLLLPVFQVRLIEGLGPAALGAVLSGTVLVVSGLLYPIVQTFLSQTPLRTLTRRICVWAGTLLLFLLVVQLVVMAFNAMPLVGGANAVLALLAGVPLALCTVGMLAPKESKLRSLCLHSFGISAPLVLVGMTFWSFETLISLPMNLDHLLGLVGALVAAALYTGFFVNINFISPHLFYRDRLAKTYLTRFAGTTTEVVSVERQLLSDMGTTHKAPYHLINAALNVPGCTKPWLRGRNTDFFLFSKHFCGSPVAGYWATREWEAADKHLDLATAIAISGGAAAPRMGMHTGSFLFVLAMLNVRLGYWLRKPSIRHAFRWMARLPPLGWLHFYRELSGQMSDTHSFLNVSDGGHIENLGIYELIRRQCKFVIAIDGEADPGRSFGGFITLLQLAKIDFGVRIEPDLSELRHDRDGHGRAHFGMARIEYPGGSIGLLLYIKSSLTGNESEFLRKFRADNPDFPHDSTSRQLFSEAQFEAYRALGEHIADDLFRPDLVGAWKVGTSVTEWFKRLAGKLF